MSVKLAQVKELQMEEKTDILWVRWMESRSVENLEQTR